MIDYINTRRGLGVLVVVVCAGVLKCVLGSTYGLIDDEAYYWVWSKTLHLGYFDQPPMIAWVTRLSTSLWGDSTLSQRLPAILCGVAAPMALYGHSKNRLTYGLIWVSIPMLFWLTLFNTPDCLLFAFWSAAIACAIRGGRYWVLCGLFCGLASMTKYTACPLFLFCAVPCWAEKKERPLILMGAGLALCILLPNLLWNWTHEWQSFYHPWGETFGWDHPLGMDGLLRHLGHQALATSPLIWLCLWYWIGKEGLTQYRIFKGSESGSRVDAISWWASAPFLLFFMGASVTGPPEAHWTAPALITAILGLTRSKGRLLRTARVGIFLGLFMNGALILHGHTPLATLNEDPGTQLVSGAGLAKVFGDSKTGKAQHEGRLPIYGERYQEASQLDYHGYPTFVFPGCGRTTEYTNRAFNKAETAIYIRPSTHGPPTCLEAEYKVVEGPEVITLTDSLDRILRRWDIFIIGRIGE